MGDDNKDAVDPIDCKTLPRPQHFTFVFQFKLPP
jgi:hypothetical protein